MQTEVKVGGATATSGGLCGERVDMRSEEYKILDEPCNKKHVGVFSRHTCRPHIYLQQWEKGCQSPLPGDVSDVPVPSLLILL